MLRTLIASSVVLSAVLMVSGCKTTEPTPTTAPASPGMINDTCPFSGEALDANSPTVAYMGKSVGLCCNGCRPRWEKMSDDDKKAKVVSYVK